MTHSLKQSLAEGSMAWIQRNASLITSAHRLHLSANFCRWNSSFHTSYDCGTGAVHAVQARNRGGGGVGKGGAASEACVHSDLDQG